MSDTPPKQMPAWFKKFAQQQSTLVETVGSCNTRMAELVKTTNEAVSKADDALKRTHELEKTVDDLRRENDDLKMNVNDLKNEILKVQCHSRRDNLIFVGIPEQQDGKEGGREIEGKLLEVLTKAQFGNARFERVHRYGQKPKAGQKPRNVIATFSSSKDRDLIWSNRQKISALSNIWILEDFPPEIKKRRQALMPALKAAQRSTDMNNAFMKVDKLFIDGRVYTADTIKDLPPSLQPEKTSVVETEDSVAFFTKNAIFSNLNPLPIKLKGTTFSCNEHFFQYEKALYFKDNETAEQILMEKDPFEMMNLAKNIKNYKHKDWLEQAEKVLTEANSAKYSQNAVARQALLATGEKKLGEASLNAFYGTSVGLFSKNVSDTTKWTGKNLMGKILTKIRTNLKGEQTT